MIPFFVFLLSGRFLYVSGKRDNPLFERMWKLTCFSVLNLRRIENISLQYPINSTPKSLISPDVVMCPSLQQSVEWNYIKLSDQNRRQNDWNNQNDWSLWHALWWPTGLIKVPIGPPNCLWHLPLAGTTPKHPSSQLPNLPDPDWPQSGRAGRTPLCMNSFPEPLVI